MKKSNVYMPILGAVLLAFSTNGISSGKSSDAYFVKVDSETTTQNNASGKPTGKRQHKPLNVTKSVDKATPNRTGDVTLKRGIIK